MSSRRGTGRWAEAPPPTAPEIDVLVPFAGRSAALAVTLAGLAAQDDPPFRVIISDQSLADEINDPEAQSMLRVLRAQGRRTEVVPHLPRRGMAEQRQFLLELSAAPRVLYLDDDVWLEPGALARLDDALTRFGGGFVGFAPQGLSYLTHSRPREREMLEFWDGPVRAERVRPESAAFDRWPLHNAANLVHAAAEHDAVEDDPRAYRIAWIGGCVLYDRELLLAAGGFDFWPQLPERHAGEDVAAEWRVMERDGGAGVLPSGAVHLEAPTTISDRRVEARDIVFREPAEDQREKEGTRR